MAVVGRIQSLGQIQTSGSETFSLSFSLSLSQKQKTKQNKNTLGEW